MSLYVKIVQIVQRQGLAVIFHVVWFSLQEPAVCALVAGLCVQGVPGGMCQTSGECSLC
jgi:hypothetical protein